MRVTHRWLQQAREAGLLCWTERTRSHDV